MPNAEIVREARVLPEGRLTLLSRSEVRELADTNRNGLHELLRRCSLAVLNSGTDIDDAGALLDLYPDFDIRVLQQDRGIKLELKNAPAQAFVDGRIITGIREQIAFLFPGQAVHPRILPTDALMEKPVDPEQLLEKVAALLKEAGNQPTQQT